MAKLIQRPTVQAEIVFTVNEAEARALDALVGYGDDAFLKIFYEKLGQHYMRPHETGLREFFRSVREMVPPILSRIDDARAVFVAADPRIATDALRKAEWDKIAAERAAREAEGDALHAALTQAEKAATQKGSRP